MPVLALEQNSFSPVVTKERGPTWYRDSPVVAGLAFDPVREGNQAAGMLEVGSGLVPASTSLPSTLSDSAQKQAATTIPCQFRGAGSERSLVSTCDIMRKETSPMHQISVLRKRNQSFDTPRAIPELKPWVSIHFFVYSFFILGPLHVEHSFRGAALLDGNGMSSMLRHRGC